MILAMSETLPLAEVKNRFSEVVERVQRERDRVVVTKNGRPAVLLVSVEEMEALEETLALLSEPTALAAIREGQSDFAAGRVEELTKAEAIERWGAKE